MSQGSFKRTEEAGSVGEKWHSASKVQRFVSTEPLSEVVRHNLLTRKRLTSYSLFLHAKVLQTGSREHYHKGAQTQIT